MPSALALSIQEESEMGQEFLAQLREQFEFVDDEFANQYINRLGNYLIKPLKIKYFPFHFYIIKDDSLNAFAAPGGHIFFFSGLIEVMESVDELAAVLCHELGHVASRHLSKRIDQSKKIGLATLAGILAGLFIGGEAAGALITGAMAAGIQAQLHYSREDERQADQLSFIYMKPGSFDPKGMITALQKIQKGSWLGGSEKIPAYLLTHPTGPERMANLDAMLSNYTPGPPTEEAAGFRALFPVFKTVITGKCLDPDDAEMIFNKELKRDPGSFLPHFGLGMAYMEASKYERAISELKIAVKGNPGFVPILRTLGEAYQMNGQDNEALIALKRALKLDRGDKATLYLLGITYENSGRYKRALPFFEKLAALRPVRVDVYYHLGISYGRENRLGLAHYNFGIYFKKKGQLNKAKFHFQKAKDLSGNNTALKKKILKETEGIKRKE